MGYRLNDLYPYFSAVAKSLVDFFHPACALDIGCAKGFLVYSLETLAVRSVGVDVSKYSLHQSPKMIKGNLILSDVNSTNLTFRNRSFDIVTLLATLEHLHKPELLVKEVTRILKPGGICYITTSSPRSKDAHKDITHVNVRSRDRWIKLFESCGFKVVHGLLLARFLMKVHIETSMRTLKSTKGTTKIGNLLGKCGKIGRAARGILAFVYSFFRPSYRFILKIPDS